MPAWRINENDQNFHFDGEAWFANCKPESHGLLYPSHQCHPSLTSIVIINTSRCTMRKWKYQIQKIDQSLVQNMGRASIFDIVTDEMTWFTSAAVTGIQNVRLYSSTEGWASIGVKFRNYLGDSGTDHSCYEIVILPWPSLFRKRG